MASKVTSDTDFVHSAGVRGRGLVFTCKHACREHVTLPDEDTVMHRVLKPLRTSPKDSTDLVSIDLRTSDECRCPLGFGRVL